MRNPHRCVRKCSVKSSPCERGAERLLWQKNSRTNSKGHGKLGCCGGQNGVTEPPLHTLLRRNVSISHKSNLEVPVETLGIKRSQRMQDLDTLRKRHQRSRSFSVTCATLFSEQSYPLLAKFLSVYTGGGSLSENVGCVFLSLNDRACKHTCMLSTLIVSRLV